MIVSQRPRDAESFALACIVRLILSEMRKLQILCVFLFALLLSNSGNAAPLREPLTHFRTVSGYILTQQNERLPGVTVVVRGFSWDAQTISDREGYFRLEVPAGSLTIRLEGKNIKPLRKQSEEMSQVKTLNSR